MIKRKLYGFIIVLIGIAICTHTAFAIEEIVIKTKIINGKKFTFIKKIDEDGRLQTEIRNAKNMLVRLVPKPKTQKVRIGRDLARFLSPESVAGTLFKVNIALQLADNAMDEKPEMGSVEIYQGYVIKQEIDGRQVTDKEFALKEKVRKQKLRITRKQRVAKRKLALQKWVDQYQLPMQKSVLNAINNGRQTITAELTRDQIQALINAKDPMILGIELWQEGEDDINDAMVATRITTSAHPNSSTRGADIGIYMTEFGCADEIHITNYDRLSGIETNHALNVGAIIRAVSPDSYLYCRGGAVLPRSTDLDGVGGNPPIYIVTRSSSSNNTTTYNILDRDWDDFVYDENVATFNSGGNTGNGTGNVRSPGKGLNIITVGNYNDSNDTIVSTSPFVNPETGNEKPEICAPGHTVTAGGITMTGTSQATPHAAAFAADMMSNSTYLQYRPYLVKAKILAAGTEFITGGYDKVGLGGIDFASGQWNGYWVYYSGSNRSFTTFDTNDGNRDGYITKMIYVSSSWDRVRVVIAWLNRGTYTYSHRDDFRPIGMDLDIRVYDPNGRLVGGSYSWDNSFEDVDFTPTISGNYEFKIRRFANRDTACNLRLGMYVNYYDD